MRRLLQVVAVALLLALPAFSQGRGFASINSWGASHLGPAPASVLSPNPLVQGPYSLGYSYIPQQGLKTYAPYSQRRMGCHGCYMRPAYPVYYPIYGYGYGYGAGPVYMEDRSSLPNAGTFEASNGESYSNEPRTPVVVIYENRSPEGYSRPSGAAVSGAAPDERYGEHYTDGREPKSEAPETRGAVTANGNEDNDTTTVLIFKDGHQLEVKNFAIMGDYIFVFAGDRRKIPLAELNMSATQKANEERGTEFRLPSGSNPS